MSYAVVRITPPNQAEGDVVCTEWPRQAKVKIVNQHISRPEEIELLEGPFDNITEAFAHYLHRIGSTATLDYNWAERVLFKTPAP